MDVIVGVGFTGALIHHGNVDRVGMDRRLSVLMIQGRQFGGLLAEEAFVTR